MNRDSVANLALVLFIGILGGLVSSYSYIAFNSKLFSPVSINKIEEKTFVQENVALEQGVEISKDSLVFFKGDKGLLTGTIITNDGLIVTSSRIQPGYKLIMSGKESSAYNIVKNDPSSGLAIVKINKGQLKPVEFFDFQKIKAGKRVYSLSIINEDSDYLVNEGIIKNLIEPIRTNIDEDDSIISSPVFDIGNRLVGIIDKDKQGKIYIIPSSRIRSLAGLD
ncbi:MAG: hypothetical protein MNSN_02900 [Minisyncoccus archaeiphilus]|uniref:S1 family peptidase n=1 Tax=Minisyncoccus archaeiphilus TaxID=3238481 RepID=UPI0009CF8CE4|nr:MAG: hypothetical protein BWY21_01201 [Parcubacteria group bacterium ADurb.Bin216]GMX59292.1 MAG: hypothetical protein MNSN_02900 [Candidatus Parcubacteria bacterium]